MIIYSFIIGRRIFGYDPELHGQLEGIRRMIELLPIPNHNVVGIVLDHGTVRIGYAAAVFVAACAIIINQQPNSFLRV